MENSNTMMTGENDTHKHKGTGDRYAQDITGEKWDDDCTPIPFQHQQRRLYKPHFSGFLRMMFFVDKHAAYGRTPQGIALPRFSMSL